VSASLAAAEQAGLGERAAEVRAAVGSQVDDDDAAAGRHGISLQAILNRESRLGELIAVRSPRRWRGPACGRDRDLPAYACAGSGQEVLVALSGADTHCGQVAATLDVLKGLRALHRAGM
jgi:hypothetical protein